MPNQLIALALLAAATLSNAQTTASPTPLTGEELRALLAGNSLDGIQSNGLVYRAHHSADGALQSLSGKYRSGGAWTIDEQGSVCVKWTNRDWKDDCWQVSRTENGYRFTSRAQPSSTMDAAQIPGHVFKDLLAASSGSN